MKTDLSKIHQKFKPKKTDFAQLWADEICPDCSLPGIFQHKQTFTCIHCDYQVPPGQIKQRWKDTLEDSSYDE